MHICWWSLLVLVVRGWPWLAVVGVVQLDDREPLTCTATFAIGSQCKSVRELVEGGERRGGCWRGEEGGGGVGRLVGGRGGHVEVMGSTTTRRRGGWYRSVDSIDSVESVVPSPTHLLSEPPSSPETPLDRKIGTVRSEPTLEGEKWP